MKKSGMLAIVFMASISSLAFAQEVPPEPTGNTSTVFQVGDANAIQVAQAADLFNNSLAVQAGNENVASIAQDGTGNDVTLIQGVNDTVNGLIAPPNEDGTPSENPFDALFAAAPVEPVESTQGAVEIVQIGDANTVTAFQGGVANAASLKQTGSGNTSTSFQGDSTAGVLAVVGNAADVTQTGDANDSTIIQAGDENVVQLTQTGGDVSTVFQLGSQNAAQVAQ
jgi:trimeric autotransporter adhesin